MANRSNTLGIFSIPVPTEVDKHYKRYYNRYGFGVSICRNTLFSLENSGETLLGGNTLSDSQKELVNTIFVASGKSLDEIPYKDHAVKSFRDFSLNDSGRVILLKETIEYILKNECYTDMKIDLSGFDEPVVVEEPKPVEVPKSEVVQASVVVESPKTVVEEPKPVEAPKPEDVQVPVVVESPKTVVVEAPKPEAVVEESKPVEAPKPEDVNKIIGRTVDTLTLALFGDLFVRWGEDKNLYKICNMDSITAEQYAIDLINAMIKLINVQDILLSQKVDPEYIDVIIDEVKIKALNTFRSSYKRSVRIYQKREAKKNQQAAKANDSSKVVPIATAAKKDKPVKGKESKKPEVQIAEQALVPVVVEDNKPAKIESNLTKEKYDAVMRAFGYAFKDKEMHLWDLGSEIDCEYLLGDKKCLVRIDPCVIIGDQYYIRAEGSNPNDLTHPKKTVMVPGCEKDIVMNIFNTIGYVLSSTERERCEKYYYAKNLSIYNCISMQGNTMGNRLNRFKAKGKVNEFYELLDRISRVLMKYTPGTRYRVDKWTSIRDFTLVSDDKIQPLTGWHCLPGAQVTIRNNNIKIDIPGIPTVDQTV